LGSGVFGMGAILFDTNSVLVETSSNEEFRSTYGFSGYVPAPSSGPIVGKLYCTFYFMISLSLSRDRTPSILFFELFFPSIF
jgi:hypothetical protein